MCLIVKGLPKIAKKDIVAYKVLEYKGELIATPFQNMYIEFDRKYVDQTLEKIDCLNSLSIGVYHLFSSFADAEVFRVYAQKEYSDYGPFCSTFKVVKAIIPKGTKYYIDRTEIGCPLDKLFDDSYGSKSVIYKNINT